MGCRPLDPQRGLPQADAVQLSIYMHGAAEQPGAVRRVVDARDRLQRADQHGVRNAGGGSHDVQAVPEAIDEVDICMTGRPEHHFRALRAAARGMRRQIARSLVGLGLDDPPDLAASGTGVDEVHAEQVARDQQGFA